MAGPVNVQSQGTICGQMFDANDKFGVGYGVKSLAQFFQCAARFTWEIASKGKIPRLVQALDDAGKPTQGPIYGMFPWRAKAPRTLAQWSFCFPAMITSTGPLKATPVNSADGTGWLTATDLDELQVYTQDGSSPAVDTFGLVIIGTEMGQQKPLFFQGGGSGGPTLYKVTHNYGTGLYDVVPYDKPDLATGVATGATVTNVPEFNRAKAIPTNNFVWGSVYGGQLYINLPLGCP